MYVDRNVKTFNDDVEEFTHIHKSIKQAYLSKHCFEGEKKFCDGILSEYARIVKDVKNGVTNVKIVKDPHVYDHCNKDLEKFMLMLRKSAMCSEYIDSCEKLNSKPFY